jgi:adenine-specific DNA-methyltransferase
VRRDRQAETDASIAKRADTEFLYDQPYEDTKRLRVTGPFTVESLSPHRTISLKRKKGLADGKEIPGVSVKLVGAGDFGNVIIENLKKAGVQNTIKNERLKFDRLDVHPGVWIHAAGEFTEKAEEEKEPAKYAKHTKKDSISRPFASFAGSSSAGRVRRVAVCIGPEHGTVGPELVKEAAKEAVQGVGFDALIVAGFAFDPHVSEEAKRYGKLVVLPTRINADLQLGDEFLKKTGAGNLFMVFGEPDIEVMRVKVGADLRAAPARARRSRATEGADDERIVVEIRGLDIYDPTTGEIRNNSTDDIACWFIDTDYNGESFFVRHAYFTGADQPYDKLKRALRAEIAEAAWSALYSTRSRPFDPPKTGKIAVKVINHYGDEVLKVYDCC